MDFSNLDLNVTTIPPCFYNLPVFQVSPPAGQSIKSISAGSPCAILYANQTAMTPKVGVTYLPDYLLNRFGGTFCSGTERPGYPGNFIDTGNVTEAGQLQPGKVLGS